VGRHVGVDDSNLGPQARSVVFGKSITHPPKPRRRAPEPLPGPPLRTLALALLATAASGYAVVRHYTRAPTPSVAPMAREIPAPELVPAER